MNQFFFLINLFLSFGTEINHTTNIFPTLSQMLHSLHHHFLFPNLPVSLTQHHYSSFSHPSVPSSHFLHRPTTPHTVSAIPPAAFSPWLTQLTTATEELGTIFAATDDASAIQVTSTVVVTAAIAVFFFPSLQRRIKRAKQLKFRSSGVKKSLDSSKVLTGSTSIKAKSPPSPDQALLGAIIAGVIAVFLYRFTTSIEAALYRQTISDNFSVRQITITIRTVINGLCYLATFVYGINSFGLLLYSGQLAINSYVRESRSGKKTESKIIEQSCLSNSSVENLTNSNNLSSTKDDQSSNNNSH